MNFFRRHCDMKIFVIRFSCRTFKEKLKIHEHHPFRLAIGVTTTYILIVFENDLKATMAQMAHFSFSILEL